MFAEDQDLSQTRCEDRMPRLIAETLVVDHFPPRDVSLEKDNGRVVFYATTYSFVSVLTHLASHFKS